MLREEVTATIARPRAELFDYLADLRTETARNPMVKRIEKAGDGPIGKGTRFRAVYRGFPRMEVELAEYEPPRRLVFAARTALVDYRYELVLDEQSDGASQLTQIGEERPEGAGRLLLAALGPVNRRVFRARATKTSRFLQERRDVTTA